MFYGPLLAGYRYVFTFSPYKTEAAAKSAYGKINSASAAMRFMARYV